MTKVSALLFALLLGVTKETAFSVCLESSSSVDKSTPIISNNNGEDLPDYTPIPKVSRGPSDAVVNALNSWLASRNNQRVSEAAKKWKDKIKPGAEVDPDTPSDTSSTTWDTEWDLDSDLESDMSRTPIPSLNGAPRSSRWDATDSGTISDYESETSQTRNLGTRPPSSGWDATDSGTITEWESNTIKPPYPGGFGGNQHLDPYEAFGNYQPRNNNQPPHPGAFGGSENFNRNDRTYKSVPARKTLSSYQPPNNNGRSNLKKPNPFAKRCADVMDTVCDVAVIGVDSCEEAWQKMKKKGLGLTRLFGRRKT